MTLRYPAPVMSFDDFGVLYLAFGHSKYLDEAAASARSVHRHMPQIRIACITDLQASGYPFELIHMEMNPRSARFGTRAGFFMKILALGRTPFKNTLYLDGDTYCCRPLWEMLSALLHSDLVGVHAPLHTTLEWSNDQQVLASLTKRAFIPHINTGVLAYRNTPEVRAFIGCWADVFENRFPGDVKDYHDQVVFQEAVARSKLKCMFLTSEFNLRVSRIATLHGPVRVLHGRPARGFERIERLCNQGVYERTVVPHTAVIRADGPDIVVSDASGGEVRRFSYAAFRRQLLAADSSRDVDASDARTRE